MEHILAERTLKVEVDGQPDATLRVVVGLPVMVDALEYRTDIEIHGPEAGAVLKRWIFGVDAWQSVCGALWICPVLAHSVCDNDARITYNGDENWSEGKAPAPWP
jgi:hypothetical protein